MLPQGKDEEKDELRGRKGGETESMERENGAGGKEKGRWRRGGARESENEVECVSIRLRVLGAPKM